MYVGYSKLFQSLCIITHSSIMFWVRSSQRRNSPRINKTEKEVWQETNAAWREKPYCTPIVSLSSISLSISFVPPSPSLHSPACGSGIDLWLHAVSFLLWNWLDMYVILCNYKSVTSTVCDPNVPNEASSCVSLSCFQGGFKYENLFILEISHFIHIFNAPQETKKILFQLLCHRSDMLQP